jgi:UDP-galactopyranose mutase
LGVSLRIVPIAPPAAPAAAQTANQTLICFSHLRWNFVLQRPQHLMSQFARERRVIYWEEPELAMAGCEPALGVRQCAETGVTIVTPSIPPMASEQEHASALKLLLDEFLAGEQGPFVRWYYTPGMLPLTRHIPAAATIYDWADKGGPSRAATSELERELVDTAASVRHEQREVLAASGGRRPSESSEGGSWRFPLPPQAFTACEAC